LVATISNWIMLLEPNTVGRPCPVPVSLRCLHRPALTMDSAGCHSPIFFVGRPCTYRDPVRFFHHELVRSVSAIKKVGPRSSAVSAARTPSLPFRLEMTIAWRSAPRRAPARPVGVQDYVRSLLQWRQAMCSQHRRRNPFFDADAAPTHPGRAEQAPAFLAWILAITPGMALPRSNCRASRAHACRGRASRDCR